MKFLILTSVDPSFNAFIEILRLWGHEVETDDRKIPFELLKKKIESLRPDLIILANNDILSLAIRRDAQEVENYLKEIGVPISMWEYEQPDLAGGTSLVNRWELGTYPQFIYYFNVDSYWAEQYRNKNLHAEFLPFGADERLQYFQPSASSKTSLASDLVYIGTAFSNTVEETVPSTKEDLCLYFSSQIAADVAVQIQSATGGTEDDADRTFSVLGSELLPIYSSDIQNPIEAYEIFRNFSHKMAKKLEKAIAVAPDDCRQLIRLRSLIGYSYSQVAQRLFELLPEKVKIYGEGSWNKILSDYPAPIRRLSYSEMYDCWALSKIVFCYTKKLFVNNVHERIFHVLGVGGFPLTDYRKDLSTLFEPDEVASYRTMAEAKELINHYTQHESDRQEIIARGRKRVFTSHTYRHRIRELVQKSCGHFGLPNPHHKNEFEPLPASPDWLATIDHVPKLRQ